MANQSPWSILGIDPGSGPETVRRAYLRLVREHHPDQFPYGSERYLWHENRLKEINQAYRQILQTPWRTNVPPRPQPPRRTTSFPMHCTPHRRWAVIYCLVCGAALCSRCDPALSGYCRAHRPASPF